jgi:hypothetical protein
VEARVFCPIPLSGFEQEREAPGVLLSAFKIAQNAAEEVKQSLKLATGRFKK